MKFNIGDVVVDAFLRKHLVVSNDTIGGVLPEGVDGLITVRSANRPGAHLSCYSTLTAVDVVKPDEKLDNVIPINRRQREQGKFKDIQDGLMTIEGEFTELGLVMVDRVIHQFLGVEPEHFWAAHETIQVYLLQIVISLVRDPDYEFVMHLPPDDGSAA